MMQDKKGFLGALVLIIFFLISGYVVYQIIQPNTPVYSTGNADYDSYSSPYSENTQYAYDTQDAYSSQENYPAYDGYSQEYADSQDYHQPSNSNLDESHSACGYLNQPCCQDARTLSPIGVIDATPPCKDYLSCMGGICVEGPTYEAYDRNG